MADASVGPVDMRRRRLGASGIEVFPLGVGCWAIGGEGVNLGLPMGWSTADDKASLQGLRRAFELGATLFDTADIYVRRHPRPDCPACEIGYQIAFLGDAQQGLWVCWREQPPAPDRDRADRLLKVAAPGRPGVAVGQPGEPAAPPEPASARPPATQPQCRRAYPDTDQAESGGCPRDADVLPEYKMTPLEDRAFKLQYGAAQFCRLRD